MEAVIETIGEILEDGTIIKGYSDQGMIYKNWTAFESKTDEVCYVPEYSTDSTFDIETVDEEEKYNYLDFLRIAQEFIDRCKEVQEYCERENTTAHDIATNLFEMVDWQHPETLVDEWETNGSYTE